MSSQKQALRGLGEAKKYADKPGYANLSDIVPPPNWQLRFPDGYNDSNVPNFHEDEHFQNWMRTAGLPTFTKLWGRNDEDKLVAATYQITAFMSKCCRLVAGIVADRLGIPDFPVKPYKGTKSIVISTVSWMGGKNPFLGGLTSRQRRFSWHWQLRELSDILSDHGALCFFYLLPTHPSLSMQTFGRHVALVLEPLIHCQVVFYCTSFRLFLVHLPLVFKIGTHNNIHSRHAIVSYSTFQSYAFAGEKREPFIGIEFLQVQIWRLSCVSATQIAVLRTI